MNKMFIQFDVEPQQTVLSNLQMGLQIVATINIENLIDEIFRGNKDETATLLGKQLIELLKVNGSLFNAVDPIKHVENITNLKGK